MASTIRFLKHCVKSGGLTARVHYSLDNHISGCPCVTIYAKDYGPEFDGIFGPLSKNDTDIQSDYIVRSRANIFEPAASEDRSLYEAARACAERVKAERRAKAAEKQAQYEAARRARTLQAE